jgi:hypothetical protein
MRSGVSPTDAGALNLDRSFAAAAGAGHASTTKDVMIPSFAAGLSTGRWSR